MGYFEIDDMTYHVYYIQAINHFLGMGFSPEEARNEANKRMSRSYVARSQAIDLEYQKDDRDRANGAGPEGREWFE